MDTSFTIDYSPFTIMINRNNYEEYFLLLADNELLAEEATAVKQFAAQHPDLAEELYILMSCRLEDAPMPVFPKEKLLRPALWEADNIEPVQTQMLLLLDNELPKVDKQQLEQQIAASVALQAEWATLQQTKLAADVVAHPDKESLQRNDRKVRPLLWMRWAAAAAVVAGSGWLFWLQQEQVVFSGKHTAANTSLPKKMSTPVPATPINTQPQTIAAATEQNVQPDIKVPATQTANNHLQQANARPEKQQTTTLLASNETPAVTDPVTENASNETEPVTARLRSADISLTNGNTQADPTMQVAQLSPKTVTLPVLASNLKTASFTGSKNDLAAEESDYVNIGGARVNKQKMRGLFRNVTRTVARSFSKSKVEPDVYAAR